MRERKFQKWVASERKWVDVETPNLGAPPAGYVPWTPNEEETKAIKAGGVITPAAIWDNMTEEQRKVKNPNWNPKKRFCEQKENRAVAFNS